MQDVSQEESTIKRPHTQQNANGRKKIKMHAHLAIYSNQDDVSKCGDQQV